jgi:hypothetical protein
MRISQESNGSKATKASELRHGRGLQRGFAEALRLLAERNFMRGRYSDKLLIGAGGNS